MTKKYTRFLLILLTLAALGFGGVRGYYALTDGFRISNIHYTLPYDLLRPVRAPTTEEKELANHVLDQDFYYLGKGCQSYVFVSADGHYVIKFFKFHRYRPQYWLDHLNWIPGVKKYRDTRWHHKRQRVDHLLTASKLAWEELPIETAMVYVKLDAKPSLNRTITLHDKIGHKHQLLLDDVPFMVQHKAEMLCPTIEKHLASGNREGAEKLIDRLIALFADEYQRGYVDFDPAIMQNTGVVQGQPIHVDVGQLTRTDAVGDREFRREHLRLRTDKFRDWLQEIDHPLAERLDRALLKSEQSF